MRRTAPGDDPQWDLVVEIAAKLWIDGVYVTRLNPTPTQRFVDLQWAAYQAGRALGGRSTVAVGKPAGPRDPTVTVTVAYVQAAGVDTATEEAGLADLLREILEES